MKHSKSQRGVAIIEAIAVLLVMALLALGSWYVWHNGKKTDEASKQSNAGSQTTDSQKPEETPKQTDPSEDGKYLVIKEWGLRITLPETLRGDISYFINDKGERDFGGPTLVGFTSKKFSQGSLKCDYVDSLPRTLVSMYYEQSDHPNPENYEPAPFKIIEKRLYFLPETACQRAIDREGSSEDKQLIVNLKEAIQNTLEANN